MEPQPIHPTNYLYKYVVLVLIYRKSDITVAAEAGDFGALLSRATLIFSRETGRLVGVRKSVTSAAMCAKLTSDR